MQTDDERREVARRLRDDAKGGALPYSDFFGAVAYDVGVEKEHAAVLDRLADLIEPSCDRDALLALAEEIRRTSCDKVDGELTVDLIDVWGWAQAIREALGVER